MTTNREFSESEGKLTAQTQTTRKCRICGSDMMKQVWESEDGAYEDLKFTCVKGHVLWVDGIDS